MDSTVKKAPSVLWPALGMIFPPLLLTILIYLAYELIKRPDGPVRYWELALAWAARLSVPAIGFPFLVLWISRLRSTWAKVLVGLLFIGEIGFLAWFVYMLSDFCIYFFRDT